MIDNLLYKLIGKKKNNYQFKILLFSIKFSHLTFVMPYKDALKNSNSKKLHHLIAH